VDHHSNLEDKGHGELAEEDEGRGEAPEVELVEHLIPVEVQQRGRQDAEGAQQRRRQNQCEVRLRDEGQRRKPLLGSHGRDTVVVVVDMTVARRKSKQRGTRRKSQRQSRSIRGKM